MAYLELKKKILQRISQKVINILAPVFLIILILFIIAVLVFNPEQIERIYGPLIGCFLMSGVWYLSYLGRTELAAFFLILITFILIIVGMTYSGGVRAPAYISSIVLVGVIGWLYRTRIAVFCSIGVIILGGIFVWLSSEGYLFQSQEMSDLLFWISISFFVSMLTLATIIPNRMLHKTLEESEIQKEELKVAKEDAINANRLKSEFLAQMSHEIRTPINAMVSLSSLLKEDLEETATEDHKVSFRMVQRAGMRIIRTIDLLLNLSEIQAGTYEIILKKIDVYSDVLLKIIADYNQFAIEKSLKLNITTKVEDTEVVADIYTVAQIFTQLIDNSIKYTDEGEINIYLYRNGAGKLSIEITDTGIGIAEEYLPNLFDQFSQEDTGYTRKYEGNGIGLALVKKYCDMNKAGIEVESEKGKGSTFTVIF